MTVNRCPNPNCDYFNRTLPNNAKVCPMCGTALGNVVVSAPSAEKQPTLAEKSQVPQPSASSPVYAHTSSLSALSQVVDNPPVPVVHIQPPPTRPILKLMHTSGKEFPLRGEEGYIGRQNLATKSVPEIDLTGIANEKIVSRSHARIYWDKSSNAYMLVDNNSRNGTYVNGNLISPGNSYRLNHNDLLELGQEKLIGFTVSITEK